MKMREAGERDEYLPVAYTKHLEVGCFLTDAASSGSSNRTLDVVLERAMVG